MISPFSPNGCPVFRMANRFDGEKPLDGAGTVLHDREPKQKFPQPISIHKNHKFVYSVISELAHAGPT